MENWNVKYMSSIFNTAWKTTVRRPLQLVATEDIGIFAAKAFVDVNQFRNRALSLAGDELSFAGMDKIFREETGTKSPQTWSLAVKVVYWMSIEMRNMYAWFEEEGYAANIAELKKIHPGLKDARAWVKGSYKV